MRIAAAAVQRSEATVRRWSARQRQGKALSGRRGPGPRAPLSPEVRAAIETQVRALHGRVGAESLRRSFSVSRRQAAEAKRTALTAIERERQERAMRIEITAPDVVRGFDPVFTSVSGARCFVMNVLDASVPLHTTLMATSRYDGESVLRVLEQDIAENGAPVILRMDRAKQHVVEEVKALLARHDIRLLQGPPRCARFYGQLERQNRELRQWLEGTQFESVEELDAACRMKKVALNETWRRSSLGWQTAAEAFQRAPRRPVDRSELRAEIDERTERLRQHEGSRGWYAGKTERLAIEATLISRGLLRREVGGWGVRGFRRD